MIKAEQILQEIDTMWAMDEQKERDYIGASEIGHQCERYLWLKFHRYTWPEQFDPRMLRLFDRGSREELFLQCNLKGIGFEVLDDCHAQRGFKHGFFAGHWDGRMRRNGKVYTVEYKTHSDKSFKLLTMDGVKESKPQHYAQMMVYAKEQGADGAIYVAVNKNDDELHIEVLPRDDTHAEEMAARAHRIGAEFQPPKKIAKSITDYRCKFCNAKPVCHGTKAMRIDCRNCVHIDKDAVNGKFSCELGRELSPCEKHTFNPLALADVYGMKIEKIDPEQKQITFLRKDGTSLKVGGDDGLHSDEVMTILCD